MSDSRNTSPSRQRTHKPADGAPDGDRSAGSRWLFIVLLSVALFAGLIIGPWGLEQAAPATYNAIFVGGDEARTQLEDFDAEAQADRQRLVDSDVTAVAIAEWDEQTQAERAPFLLAWQQARRDRSVALRYLVFALLAIAFALGVFEAAFTAGNPSRQRPLRWAGYGSLAVALLLLGARPELLGLSPAVVVIAAIVLGMAAAAMRRAAKRETQRPDPA